MYTSRHHLASSEKSGDAASSTKASPPPYHGNTNAVPTTAKFAQHQQSSEKVINAAESDTQVDHGEQQKNDEIRRHFEVNNSVNDEDTKEDQLSFLRTVESFRQYAPHAEAAMKHRHQNFASLSSRHHDILQRAMGTLYNNNPAITNSRAASAPTTTTANAIPSSLLHRGVSSSPVPGMIALTPLAGNPHGPTSPSNFTGKVPPKAVPPVGGVTPPLPVDNTTSSSTTFTNSSTAGTEGGDGGLPSLPTHNHNKNNSAASSSKIGHLTKSSYPLPVDCSDTGLVASPSGTHSYRHSSQESTSGSSVYHPHSPNSLVSIDDINTTSHGMGGVGGTLPAAVVRRPSPNEEGQHMNRSPSPMHPSSHTTTMNSVTPVSKSPIPPIPMYQQHGNTANHIVHVPTYQLQLAASTTPSSVTSPLVAPTSSSKTVQSAIFDEYMAGISANGEFLVAICASAPSLYRTYWPTSPMPPYLINLQRALGIPEEEIIGLSDGEEDNEEEDTNGHNSYQQDHHHQERHSITSPSLQQPYPPPLSPSASEFGHIDSNLNGSIDGGNRPLIPAYHSSTDNEGDNGGGVALGVVGGWGEHAGGGPFSCGNHHVPAGRRRESPTIASDVINHHVTSSATNNAQLHRHMPAFTPQAFTPLSAAYEDEGGYADPHGSGMGMGSLSPDVHVPPSTSSSSAPDRGGSGISLGTNGGKKRERDTSPGNRQTTSSSSRQEETQSPPMSTIPLVQDNTSSCSGGKHHVRSWLDTSTPTTTTTSTSHNNSSVPINGHNNTSLRDMHSSNDFPCTPQHPSNPITNTSSSDSRGPQSPAETSPSQRIAGGGRFGNHSSSTATSRQYNISTNSSLHFHGSGGHGTSLGNGGNSSSAAAIYMGSSAPNRDPSSTSPNHNNISAISPHLTYTLASSNSLSATTTQNNMSSTDDSGTLQPVTPITHLGVGTLQSPLLLHSSQLNIIHHAGGHYTTQTPAHILLHHNINNDLLTPPGRTSGSILLSSAELEPLPPGITPTTTIHVTEYPVANTTNNKDLKNRSLTQAPTERSGHTATDISSIINSTITSEGDVNNLLRSSATGRRPSAGAEEEPLNDSNSNNDALSPHHQPPYHLSISLATVEVPQQQRQSTTTTSHHHRGGDESSSSSTSSSKKRNIVESNSTSNSTSPHSHHPHSNTSQNNNSNGARTTNTTNSAATTSVVTAQSSFSGEAYNLGTTSTVGSQRVNLGSVATSHGGGGNSNETTFSSSLTNMHLSHPQHASSFHATTFGSSGATTTTTIHYNTGVAATTTTTTASIHQGSMSVEASSPASHSLSCASGVSLAKQNDELGYFESYVVARNSAADANSFFSTSGSPQHSNVQSISEPNNGSPSLLPPLAGPMRILGEESDSGSEFPRIPPLASGAGGVGGGYVALKQIMTPTSSHDVTRAPSSARKSVSDHYIPIHSNTSNNSGSGTTIATPTAHHHNNMRSIFGAVSPDFNTRASNSDTAPPMPSAATAAASPSLSPSLWGDEDDLPNTNTDRNNNNAHTTTTTTRGGMSKVLSAVLTATTTTSAHDSPSPDNLQPRQQHHDQCAATIPKSTTSTSARAELEEKTYLEQLPSGTAGHRVSGARHSSVPPQRSEVNPGFFRPVPTQTDIDKAFSTLRQFVRDWSAEGACERAAIYSPIIDALCALYPAQQSRVSTFVLVPGAGLSRLTVELASHGFNAISNEFSYHMLLAGDFAMNHLDKPNMFETCPFVDNTLNLVKRSHQMRNVMIPDVSTYTLKESVEASGRQFGSLSMVAGDFMEVFSRPLDAGRWDAVASCFFLDTAHNILEYLDVLHYLLKPGGYIVNLGPLLYHFADSVSERSIELSLEELLHCAAIVGFRLVPLSEITTTPTPNPAHYRPTTSSAAYQHQHPSPAFQAVNTTAAGGGGSSSSFRHTPNIRPVQQPTAVGEEDETSSAHITSLGSSASSPTPIGHGVDSVFSIHRPTSLPPPPIGDGDDSTNISPRAVNSSNNAAKAATATLWQQQPITKSSTGNVSPKPQHGSGTAAPTMPSSGGGVGGGQAADEFVKFIPCSYTNNPTSMKQLIYNAGFFVLQKISSSTSDSYVNSNNDATTTSSE